MAEVIKTENLSKVFRVSRKEPGLWGSIKSLARREYKIVEAVKNISLSISEGELVGFIGPNGAGKTTMLKMLSGLLYPTAGEAKVLGFAPWERRRDFLKQFSLVMGQKAQLWWDLPLYDSLLLQRDIYDMPASEFKRSLDELTELLSLSSFLKVQVRKLSLGQRMRGELAAAFIYRPKVLYLDEPTIGLDILVQRRIRDFIADYNQRYGATIILTSHYLEDVSELCRRLIVIDHGRVGYDGQTDELIRRHIDHKRVVLKFDQPVDESALAVFGKVISYQPLKATLQVPRLDTASVAAALLSKLPAIDVAIEEPSLADVARELFTGRDYA